MTSSSSRSEKIPVSLPDGGTILVEVTSTGREDVSFNLQSFQSVISSIQSISKAIAAGIAHVNPTKASVTYGLEITIEQGSLMAALVRGKGTANLEITLEWDHSSRVQPPQSAQLVPPMESQENPKP